MINALTIDVEDAYNLAMRQRMGIDRPPTEAVVRTTNAVLELLAKHQVKATFFVLGEVAAAFPQLIKNIAGAGHEIGVHGYYHHKVFELTPDQFRRQVGDAKNCIEDTAQTAAMGHRAPAFSIIPESQWALETLAELGFKYDSSVFPIRGRRYGWPGFRPDIHEMTLPNGASIIEAPLSTVRVFGKALPACGGGYLRHFPYFLTRWAMRRIQRLRPAIVYLHPYDMDTNYHAAPQSYLEALSSADKTVRKQQALQLRNRDTVERKLNRMLKEFYFAPLREVIAMVLGSETIAMDKSTEA